MTYDVLYNVHKNYYEIPLKIDSSDFNLMLFNEQRIMAYIVWDSTMIARIVV